MKFGYTSYAIYNEQPKKDFIIFVILGAQQRHRYMAKHSGSSAPSSSVQPPPPPPPASNTDSGSPDEEQEFNTNKNIFFRVGSSNQFYWA